MLQLDIVVTAAENLGNRLCDSGIKSKSNVPRKNQCREDIAMCAIGYIQNSYSLGH